MFLWQPCTQCPNHDMTHDSPIREDACGLPPDHDGGIETHDQRGAVKEHVEAVRDEAQTVGPHSIQQLYKCECWMEKKRSASGYLFNNV